MIKYLKFGIGALITLLAWTTFALGQDQALQVRFKQAMEADPRMRDLSWITSEQRQSLIRDAQNNLKSPADNVKMSAKEQLAALEDSDTLQELANEAKAGNGYSRWILLTYGDEAALSGIIELVHSSSTDRIDGGGVSELSDRDMLILGAFRIIARSKSFPQRTRSWAAQIALRARTSMTGLGPQGTAGKSLLIWWDHNKDKILEKRYRDATWTE